MLDRVRAYVKEHQMIEPGGKVAAGVSGGPDSICLLLLLKELCRELEACLCAVHVHHGLRGAEADRDEAFVKQLCGAWQIPFYSAHEDAFVLCGYQFVLGGLLLLAGGLAGGGVLSGFDLPSLLILAYMGVLSAVAYTIWSILTKYNPVASVTIYGFLNPVFGVLLSALLLGEQNQAFTVYGLAALVLVCLGIFLVNRAKG